MIVYKALHDQSPVYMRKLLQVYIPTRNLRSQNNATSLVVQEVAVMFGDRSFAVAAPRLWNSLPEGIRDSSSLANFKTCYAFFYFMSWVIVTLLLLFFIRNCHFLKAAMLLLVPVPLIVSFIIFLLCFRWLLCFNMCIIHYYALINVKHFWTYSNVWKSAI